MTPFKTVLMTAAFVALPCAALAQIPGAITDQVKDKAVDTVIENATADDALTAGSVIFKGGSKEDAAIAIVKNRGEKKIEGVVGDQVGDLANTGTVKDALSGEVPSSATVYDDAKGSATTYAKDKANEASSSTVYSDGAKGSATTYSGQTPTGTTTLPSQSAPVQAVPPLNCPAGTKAQADGTCMVTGNWGG